MSLSGQQRKKLQLALIDAFPNVASLERILAFELNKNLRAIAGEGSLQDIVFKLIQTAEAEGWVKDLVDAACNSNPGNPQLRAIETLRPFESPGFSTPQMPSSGKKSIVNAIAIICGLSGFIGISYIFLNQENPTRNSASPSLNRKYFYNASSTATDKWCLEIYQNLRERQTGEVPEDVAFVGVDKKKAQCFYETN